MLILITVWSAVRIVPLVENPMRRSTRAATNYVLSLTPIGTHIDDAVSIVENHRDWSIWWINYERGFPHPSFHTIVPRPDERPFIVGDMSMRVEVGRFRPANILIMGLLMETVVSVFYGFDAGGYLTEVYVWTTHR